MSNPLTQAKDPQTAFSEYVYTSEEATNALLIIVSTGFIFLMQAGFAMVEVGSVR